MAKVQAALSQYFKDFKYVFYCMLHPFKGFWELKHDKKARTAVSVTMYILLVLSQLISKQFTAYSFNELRLRPEAINIFSDIVVFALAIFLWCYSNWGITTLFNGEGSVKDVFHYTAYSLMPYVLFTLGITVLSQIMTVDESSIYTFLTFLGTFWSAMLVYCGTMTTHQYGAMGTIFAIIVILFGMLLILFIGMLFFFLLQQIFGIIYTIYRELTMRY